MRPANAASDANSVDSITKPVTAVLMPTLVGDVVVEHSTAATRRYSVWRVMRDGEQSANPLAYVSFALGAVAALALARMMVRRNRIKAVYLMEQDIDTWTKVSD